MEDSELALRMLAIGLVGATGIVFVANLVCWLASI